MDIAPPHPKKKGGGRVGLGLSKLFFHLYISDEKGREREGERENCWLGVVGLSIQSFANNTVTSSHVYTYIHMRTEAGMHRKKIYIS